MAKGDVLPAESTAWVTQENGVRLRQVTTHRSVHHHPFYYIPAYDRDMRWLFFASHRTGNAQFFAERRRDGNLIQLTDRDDLNEWSLHPSTDGRFLFFTTTSGGWRLDTDSLVEEQIIDFAGAEKSAGMVGAGMGTTTLSHDDQWWAIPVRRNDVGQLLIVDVQSGESHVACENQAVGHPQFHPTDSDLIRYGGPYENRLWVTDRSGANHRLVYQRDASRKEWIVHECWRPGTREILTTNWPHGVMSIDIDSRAVRWVTRFNAWHPMVDPQGRAMVCDTKNPDIGLQHFDIGQQESAPQLLVLSESSNVGEHWNTDHCPYDDGPVDVYAPQHTHPHPTFSPDGNTVLFTSDRTGHAQLYEVSGWK